MTPEPLAAQLVAPLDLGRSRTILEPSFGDGSFLLALLERLIDATPGPRNAALGRALTGRLWGVELDPGLHERALARIRRRFGPLPAEHNLVLGDYFRLEPELRFDLIVGNPPFGGTFDARIEDRLDRRFGAYDGDKVKKETYSFFVAKALDELAGGGTLRFICSDTFLTIKTMKGLRRLLVDRGSCTVERIAGFSEETLQPMVVLTVVADGPAGHADVLGTAVTREAMASTKNFSWTVNGEYARYFAGPTIGDFMVATGGMTIGRNEWFLREAAGGEIEEPFDFEFFEEPVTLEGERARARLHRLTAAQEAAVARGDTRRCVRAVPLPEPRRVSLPHADYLPYNKASSERLFAPHRHYVFWRDGGEAVLCFKKSGPWYLRGVGGAPYFGREGITWQLVAPRLNARYLPPDSILDSGAPCAFLRDGVSEAELWFVLGWLQTALASSILKTVINHTRNIQGKDVERLPYPFWVPEQTKAEVAGEVRAAVQELVGGGAVDRVALERRLERAYALSFAQESLSPSVRLKTSRSGVESGSAQK
jgi:hypothetical protein